MCNLLFVYSRGQKYVLMLKNYYSTLYLNYGAYYACTYYTKLQDILHKTTDCATLNYRQNYM